MGPAPPKILAIDDDRHTVDGLLSELRIYYGIVIEVAETIAQAEARLKETSFDFLIVDLRFAYNGHVVEDAGLQLMLRLRVGKYGETNKSTPYLLLTAQDFHLGKVESKFSDAEIAIASSGRVATIGKGYSIRELADKIGATLGLARRNLGETTSFHSSRS